MISLKSTWRKVWPWPSLCQFITRNAQCAKAYHGKNRRSQPHARLHASISGVTIQHFVQQATTEHFDKNRDQARTWWAGWTRWCTFPFVFCCDSSRSYVRPFNRSIDNAVMIWRMGRPYRYNHICLSTGGEGWLIQNGGGEIGSIFFFFGPHLIIAVVYCT